MFRPALATLALITVFGLAAPSYAQTASRGSVAAEADVLAYGLPGYSAIVNVTLPNGLQFAFGVGRYEVPSFLLSGDTNDQSAEWQATVTSLQVARVTYRFRGAMRSGPAVGAVLLNQQYRLRSAPLDGETRFRPLSVGVTAGYYVHVGRHFYVYPTAAYTYNRVVAGTPSIKGIGYEVERFSPNASLHAGWEWGR
ncbi:MAG: hypothetical protein AB7Q29_05565 [Vicinamibacterales bacterium]